MNQHGPLFRANRPLKQIRRYFFPRGLTFTREGKVYIGVTLGVGFAAVNTANNLLFLVLGLMLGLIVVSGILSEITLRGVEVHRRLPTQVEGKVPFAVQLALRNKKRLASSFGVELRDEIDGKPFRRRCFFLRVGPGEERAVAYRCELKKRGRVVFDGTLVSTRFPFGFFEKKRFIPLKDEIVVLPAVIDLEAPKPSVLEGGGNRAAELPGPGQEFRDLRDMAHGDDPRRIHWKSTARLGRPIVRETDADAQGYLEVVLDAAASGPDEASLEQAEKHIRAAGTVVRQMASKSVRVRLVTDGEGFLETSSGSDSAVPLLVHLALLDTTAARDEKAPTGQSPTALLIGKRARSSGHGYRLIFPKRQTASEVFPR